MKKIIYIIIILLFAVAAVSGFFFFREYETAQEEISEYAQIQSGYTSVLIESTPNDSSDNSDTLPETAGLPYTTADFDLLLETNPETVGWLAIPGTVISYPVLQTTDNDKYLHTSFNGKRSSAGAVFMDHGNSAYPLDKNTIVYGHNMGRGREDMFGSLLHYNEQEYCRAHKWIQFDTVHKQYGWWRVFAVIHLDVRAGGFDYLKQSFTSAAEFEAWIAEAKAASVYDSDIEITADAHILTLSTCNRADYGSGGRQVIMAVHMNEQD